MKNKELAKIFQEMAFYFEMENIEFKPYAYQKVALALESLEEDVEKIYKNGGVEALENISGVGKNIARGIEEYIKTGKIKQHREFKRKIPVNIDELKRVEGLGSKKIKILFEKLKVKNLKDLEKAARSGKIAPLFGFALKTEKNILENISFLKKSKGRFLLGEILPKAEDIYQKLKKLKEVEKIDSAGSLRRRRETIGDVDFLTVCSFGKDKVIKIMDYFTQLPDVIKVWGKGNTKSSVRMKEGFDVDIRVVPARSYGAALQYFTGSKEHNIGLRRIAMAKGLKLSEYGLFKGSKAIAGKTEEGIYQKLGMECPPPELRENQGEIKAALEKNLPRLIDFQDIKGDLHCHSNWDGGLNTIEEMAEAAKKMGYHYLGISDHTKFLRIENGLDERELAKQRKEIDKLNFKLKAQKTNFKFQILHGCEVNILNNGSVDIKNDTLKKMDYVIAGIHSNFKISKEKMTERMIRAMKNPNIDIISHPTGRILKKRDEYQIDFDKILRAAKGFGVILEINSCPERLDLNDQNIKRAKEAGVKMIINTDSHRKNNLDFMRLGVSQARRGWAEKKDIINTQPLKGLLKFFKK